MCTYISVVLPKTANLEACRTLFIENKLALEMMEPEGAPDGVLSTENYYFTCAGHCDCGTSIGSVRTESRATPDTHEISVRSNLRKKGWSETKIKRRLQELEKTTSKNERAKEGKVSGGEDEIDRWMTLINDIVSNELATHIGVTVNDYTGPISNPKFALKRVNTSPSKLTSVSLERLAAATLLVVG
jgi:hypothetical protein